MVLLQYLTDLFGFWKNKIKFLTCREEGCKVIRSAPVTLNTAGTLHKAWWKPKAYILVGNHLALA